MGQRFVVAKPPKKVCPLRREEVILWDNFFEEFPPRVFLPRENPPRGIYVHWFKGSPHKQTTLFPFPKIWPGVFSQGRNFSKFRGVFNICGALYSPAKVGGFRPTLKGFAQNFHSPLQRVFFQYSLLKKFPGLYILICHFGNFPYFLAQMSSRYTGSPLGSSPRGRFRRSTSILPAMAKPTTSMGEARKFPFIF